MPFQRRASSSSVPNLRGRCWEWCVSISCREAAQSGLVLATELLTVNSGIEACIRAGRLSQIPGLIQIGAKDGMHTVDDSLIELLLADRISLMDAMAHARDPNFVKEEFQKALKSQRKGWFAGMFRQMKRRPRSARAR